jgi:hypothetical protein
VASKKNESGRKPSGSKGVSAITGTFRVTNTANQPREFKLSGQWYRWEPRGRAGDSLSLSEGIVKKSDFNAVSHYFAVQKEGA